MLVNSFLATAVDARILELMAPYKRHHDVAPIRSLLYSLSRQYRTGSTDTNEIRVAYSLESNCIAQEMKPHVVVCFVATKTSFVYGTSEVQEEQERR